MTVDGTSNGSDSKKLRVEEALPSRVIHIRRLPTEAMDAEVIALGLPFGKVTNILTLKGKNQVSERLTAQSVRQHEASAEMWKTLSLAI